MIDRAIQRELFDEYGTPEHVRRHCDAVTQAAVRIGEALNRAGCHLDLALIEGAARVHDVARTAPNHAAAGAEFLIGKGYTREAELVRGHMSHSLNKPEDIDEQDVLCLADRVVREDEYVGIEKRAEYLVNKPGVTEEGAVMIRSVLAATQVYIHKIESIIGITFDELLGT